jgi:beta-lactamase regulating signal transducer with metallopeptidase domain
MIAHLFESTLLLAIAILMAQMPMLAARTRYAVVFAALIKFAIPSAIVPRALALFGIDLARMPKGTIIIDALGPMTATNLPTTTATIWPVVLIALWLTIAVALLARALVRGRAATRLALSGAADADARELVALTRARNHAGVTRTVRLVRSTAITSPATAGFLRPVIVIPAGTYLGDAELETILTHECAHIARHDNVLGMVESIVGSALWFHPLVWIARRSLDAAREEACDAAVIATSDAGVYVTALSKVCGAAVAPHAAGISCIVSNTIRERMEAIMSFRERRHLSHQAVTATVIALLATATIGAGIARARPSANNDARYRIESPASRAIPNGTKSSSNENISLDLKDADVRDVLETFSKLTKIKIVADDNVSGRVTISVHDVPWKEVFAKILDDENLRQERIGDTIHVHRK